jgi:hypothetical protein
MRNIDFKLFLQGSKGGVENYGRELDLALVFAKYFQLLEIIDYI